jgi:GNAT superfamily N-acetyltransferase
VSDAGRQTEISIVGYDDRYADAFDRLNREWLERYFTVEDLDRKYIEHPRESIVDAGGEIFFALAGDEVVGTCAAIRSDAGTVELAKLAVAERARGRGLGRRLSEAVVAWARAAGARKVVLVSSTKLAPALRLYESMGFRYAPLPPDPGYASADIYMELQLEP